MKKRPSTTELGCMLIASAPFLIAWWLPSALFGSPSSAASRTDNAVLHTVGWAITCVAVAAGICGVVLLVVAAIRRK